MVISIVATRFHKPSKKSSPPSGDVLLDATPGEKKNPKRYLEFFNKPELVWGVLPADEEA